MGRTEFPGHSCGSLWGREVLPTRAWRPGEASAVIRILPDFDDFPRQMAIDISEYVDIFECGLRALRGPLAGRLR